MGFPLEPYRAKVVESIPAPSREVREAALRRAGFNVFGLRSDEVVVDLLTDSGTGAMSDRQWSAMMTGDESYAGAHSFDELRTTVEDVFGMPWLLPVHQGRGAENVLGAALVKPGDVVPGNAHFDTTRAHIEHRGAAALDCTVDAAKDLEADEPFKGNVDLRRLDAALREHAGHVPYVLLTITCNTAGGQPVSLANARDVREMCDRHGVPLILDAARHAENAFLVKEREKEVAAWSVAAIARAFADLADAVAMSGKKDALTNIGGILAFRERAWYDRCVPYAVLYEGFVTYGGLAGRDLAAMAVGLREALDERYLTHRVHQVRALADRMAGLGLPVMRPAGGHAVYVDANRFLPHLGRAEWPGQALVVELYREGGVRTVEIGGVMAGRDPATGKDRFDGPDLVRFAVPRRAYSNTHLAWVAEIAEAVWARREGVQGLEFELEAPILRHFTSRFRPRAAAPKLRV